MSTYSVLRKAAKHQASPDWINHTVSISDPQDPYFHRLSVTPDGLRLQIAVCNDAAADAKTAPDGAVGVWIQLWGPLGSRLQERYHWGLPMPAGWAASPDWPSFCADLSQTTHQLIDQLPPDEDIGLELMNRGKTLRECGASLLQ